MKVLGVLETALHVSDVATAKDFYTRLFGFEVMVENERLCAFNVSDRSVLLLFKKGATGTPLEVPGGIIPPHDGAGRLHFAFAIAADDLPQWEERLAAEGIAVEGRVNWPAGGKSVYFRDLDEHLVELATPGIWPKF
jgi:catechol 2,3-dioxygenase-like lactoylglutathione lyase family enzyme